MAGPRASGESRLEPLAEEQAALRRVATLVAQGAPAETLFTVVAEQVAEILSVPLVSIVRYELDGTATERASVSPHGTMFRVGTRWSLEGTNVVALVRYSAQPARIDDYSGLAGMIAEACRRVGIRSRVGIPIIVAGRLWGAMVVSSLEPDILPQETEARLTDFTELVATAIANSEARDEASRLAAEQAALRRVATRVAEDVPSSELFHAVAREVGTLLGADFAGMARFDDGDVVTVSAWAAEGEFPPFPDRWPMQPGDPATTIAEASQAARWVDWRDEAGPIAAFIRDEMGVSSTVGCPIVVAGRVWGALAVHSKQTGQLPPDTEARVAQFTDLVSTSIASAETRAEVARLAREQASLRRVATLVAREASQSEVFTAIAEEIGRLLGTEEIRMVRYEDERSAIVVASSGEAEDLLPVGTRVPLGGEDAISRVLKTRQPARIDDYATASGIVAEPVRSIGIRGVVATPVVVEGRLWGAMVTGTSQDEPLPPQTESRLGQFTDLIATAIANAEARSRAGRLAEEQAALRRVATLVAQEAPPGQVFAAVADEVAQLLRVEDTTIFRYEDDWTATVVADRGERDVPSPIGSRMSLEGESATALVRRTGRAARVDDFSVATGPLADYTRDAGIGSTVGSPIVVDGRLWGAMIAATRTDEPMPADTESRIEQFTELVATAISNMQARSDNMQARSDLAASRARLVTAGDEARRRVVRDLHDGAQQRLVHTIVMLKLAQRSFRDGDGKTGSLLGEALEQAERGNEELRELAHGILPAALTQGGLQAGVDAVVTRVDLPVAVDVPAERFPAETEASAYFIVAEALTNVVKHSNAESAEVRASVEGGMLHVEVRDDGNGGADPDGHGLLGMTDRVTALGGRLAVDSPVGGGTLVAATLPLSAT
jgi:GAF domain-containing protein